MVLFGEFGVYENLVGIGEPQDSLDRWADGDNAHRGYRMFETKKFPHAGCIGERDVEEVDLY